MANVSKLIFVTAALALGACSSNSNIPLCQVPPIVLTPAPQHENPLHRWQRTEADYRRISKQMDDGRRDCENATSDKFAFADMPAFEAFNDAEKALKAADCSTVCKPQ